MGKHKATQNVDKICTEYSTYHWKKEERKGGNRQIKKEEERNK
jgi:hypothetical protein